jgi:hypothetical protein
MQDDNRQNRRHRSERADQSMRLFFTLLAALAVAATLSIVSVESTSAQPVTCGNGLLDLGEDCDLSSPAGAFCPPGGVCNSSCDCVFIVPTTTPTTTSTSSTTEPEHQQCYEIKPAAFSGPSVTAQDQFGTLSLPLIFPHRLCAPANKNNEGINDPTEHLAGYKTRAVFSKRLNHTVVNQFGTLQVDIIRPDMFMVPTAKNGVPVAQPTGDHFTCYKVKRSRGTPKFIKQTVTVVDQFQSTSELVIKPVRLCAPANKNGEDPTAPAHPGHILCYKVKSQTKFGTLVVQIDNQFGPDQVTLIHRRELCVPTLKDPGATTTSTTIQATTTTSSTVATTSSSLATTSSSLAATTSTTSTTLYGSPSRAFVTPVRSLFD